MKTLRLEVTVIVDYTCSEFDAQALKDNLYSGIYSLYEEGVLTEYTGAECDEIAVIQTSYILTDAKETP